MINNDAWDETNPAAVAVKLIKIKCVMAWEVAIIQEFQKISGNVSLLCGSSKCKGLFTYYVSNC